MSFISTPQQNDTNVSHRQHHIEQVSIYIGLTTTQPVVTQPVETYYQQKRSGSIGDLLIQTTFPANHGEIEQYIIDITVQSNHVKSNRSKIIRKIGDTFTYQSGRIAEDGYKRKTMLYRKWDHGGHIKPMAFDSAGNISKGSMEFIDYIYADRDDENEVKRRWDNEGTRIEYKKRFLDSLSCVMTAAMARDIRAMDRLPSVNGKPKRHIMKRVDDIFDIKDIYEEEEAITDIDQSSSESENVSNISDAQQESDEDTSDSSDGDESSEWNEENLESKRLELNQPHKDARRRLRKQQRLKNKQSIRS